MPFATEINPVTGTLDDTAADLLVLPVQAADGGPAAVDGVEAGGLDRVLPAPLTDLFTHYSLTGKAGESVQFPVTRTGPSEVPPQVPPRAGAGSHRPRESSRD